MAAKSAPSLLMADLAEARAAVMLLGMAVVLASTCMHPHACEAVARRLHDGLTGGA